MMNLIALSLLISTLAAAGFLSPPPDPNPRTREGHRLFVVEYERQVPSPSSSSHPSLPVSVDLSENFKNNLLDAASVFPHSPKEKISSLITKTKHKAAQLEESSADAVKAVAEKAKDAGKEVAANISAATRKAVNRAEVAAAELQGNLTDVMRRARDFGRDVALHVAAGSRRAARSAAAIAYLLGFAIALGTCVWVTFASNHVLASALPRQQLGIVQSRIYPVYFRAVGFSVGVAVAAFFLGGGRPSAVEKAQGYNLLGVLGMVMVNMLYLEPTAAKTMFEKMKLEKEEGRRREITDDSAEPAVMGLMLPPPPPLPPIGLGQATTAPATTDQEAVKSRMSRLNKRLERLNTYSSYLNVLTLMALSWHLVHLSQRLEFC